MQWVKSWLRCVYALLLELSDQAAYERYLARRGAQPSKGEWMRFHTYRLASRYSNPKCC